MTRENPASRRPPCRSLTGVRILATGAYAPDLVVSTEHLEQRLGFKAGSLYRLTGIRERRHALPHQATSDLCCEAARRCLERARVLPRDVDLLVLATVTADATIPATACLVQDRLGLCCPAFDLAASCAGFVYALVTAASYVAAGTSDLALVVGGDCLSRVTDPQDATTFPLFGDGAGAVLLTRGRPDQGLLSYSLGSDGSRASMLARKGCGSRLPPTEEVLAAGHHFLRMDGRGVFEWAVRILCDTMQDVLRTADLTPGDVDLYVPHQANVRIINAAMDVLGIPRGLVFTNLERYGNTSAASVPLALDEAVSEDRVREGDRIMLAGFGAGLAWGTALWRW